MQLSVESLRQSGGFTGAPVKRQIAWEKGGDTLVFDVWVRRLSYQTAVTDAQSLAGHGDLAASRIAYCICDESGEPVFTVADVTGRNPDGTPITEVVDGVEVERGGLDGDLTMVLLGAIGEVNGLGKPGKSVKSRKKKNSSAS